MAYQLFQGCSQLAFSRNQQLHARHGRDGSDQGLEAFVVGQPPDGQQAQPGVGAPALAVLQRCWYRNGFEVQAQRNDLAFAAPGTQGIAGLKIGRRRCEYLLGAFQQGLLERPVQHVGQCHGPLDVGHHHIGVPVDDPGTRRAMGR